MKNYDFDWQINEFIFDCRSTHLRERTMYSYKHCGCLNDGVPKIRKSAQVITDNFMDIAATNYNLPY